MDNEKRLSIWSRNHEGAEIYGSGLVGLGKRHKSGHGVPTTNGKPHYHVLMSIHGFQLRGSSNHQVDIELGLLSDWLYEEDSLC